MKELRASEAVAELRVLFAFDPRRNATLLVGGNKAGDWDGWDSRNIPLADDLYEAHLHALDTEGRRCLNGHHAVEADPP